MTIARILSIGVAVMFALTIGIATFDPTYADRLELQVRLVCLLNTLASTHAASCSVDQKSNSRMTPK
jgi:hypothetical protein